MMACQNLVADFMDATLSSLQEEDEDRNDSTEHSIDTQTVSELNLCLTVVMSHVSMEFPGLAIPDSPLYKWWELGKRAWKYFAV